MSKALAVKKSPVSPSQADEWASVYDRGFRAGYAEAADGIKAETVPEIAQWRDICNAPLDGTPVVIDAHNGPTVCRYTAIPERSDAQWWCVDNLGQVGTQGYGAIAYPKRWRPVSTAWAHSPDKRYERNVWLQT